MRDRKEYKRYDIFTHGLHWAYTDDGLPMKLNVKRWRKIIVGLFFLPFSLVVFLLGVGWLAGAKKEFALILPAIGLFTVGFLVVKACLSELFIWQEVEITRETVIFKSNLNGWNEPMLNYAGIAAFRIPPGENWFESWGIMLDHQDITKRIPIEIHRRRDQQFLSRLHEFSKLFGVRIADDGQSQVV